MPQSSLSVSLAERASPIVWHMRLSHPKYSHLHCVFQSNNRPCSSSHIVCQCQACPLENFSRQLLAINSNKSTAPLQLIYSDVRGLAPILSNEGFHYFIIFMDHFLKIYLVLSACPIICCL